jgi:hypothetical protein
MPEGPPIGQREYYAGQALAGLMANPEHVNREELSLKELPLQGDSFVTQMAKLAWALADAMLKEKT